jgi:ribosome-binding protein aMBF1 (putative translation factor)
LEGLPIPKERRASDAKNGRQAKAGRRHYKMTSEKQQLQFLGQAIRSIREQKGFNLHALGTAIGVPPERLRSLEAGKRDPDYELLLRLAECLGTRLSVFVIRAEELGGAQDE